MKIVDCFRKFRRASAQTCAALGVSVLAGGMLFVGTAGADVLFTEDFESATNYGGGAAGLFAEEEGGTESFGAYLSVQDYSGTGGPHTDVVTDGGSFYGHTIGVPYPRISVDFSSGDLALISAGMASIDFDGWLASFTGDGDTTNYFADFYDAVGGVNGTGNLLGTIVLADGSISNGDPGWNEDNWSRYTTSNQITFPDALSVTITYGAGTGGNGNDNYSDNVTVSVNESKGGGSCSFAVGDVSQDGFVDLLDVSPFVTILTAGDFQCEADIDENGVVDLLDVSPFVDLLTGG